MSENGPREGTKDLPRRHPEAGHRSVDPDSPAGLAYARLARAEARRREEIRELQDHGLSGAALIAEYGRRHPMERPVSPDEIRSADRS